MSGEDRVSYWSQDADGRPIKVTIVGNWNEDEFGNPLPSPEKWWRRLWNRIWGSPGEDR